MVTLYIQARMLEENAKIIRRYGTRPVDDEMQEFRRNLPAWGSRIRQVIITRLPDGKIGSRPYLGLRRGGGRGGAIQGKEGIKFCRFSVAEP